MRLKVSGKNIEITAALRNTVEKKISKLEKYFSPDVEANATLSVEKNRQIAEVVISVGGMLLRAEEAHDDMYASIDLVVGKLEGQIRKQKTKLQRRKHMESVRFQDIPDYANESIEENKIVRTKKFPVKPMSSEEAVLQMDLLGHNFFVYKDADSEEVNVVYKRKDGNYGLIEPEF